MFSFKITCSEEHNKTRRKSTVSNLISYWLYINQVGQNSEEYVGVTCKEKVKDIYREKETAGNKDKDQTFRQDERWAEWYWRWKIKEKRKTSPYGYSFKDERVSK